MIPVSRPWLPDKKRLNYYIDKIYKTHWLSNDGPLIKELKYRLEDYLGVTNLLLVANGTLALQVAYRTLNIKNKAITTPFSFAATSSSLCWENITPVYVDISPQTLTMDASLIDASLTDDVSAFVPVHVFGQPSNITNYEHISSTMGVKVIYDASHAFGVRFNNSSILNSGDASTLSFHATKLFHSSEGGAIVFKDKNDYSRARELINFGINSISNISEIGINAKMSEFHAAMGLAVLEDIDFIMASRLELLELYQELIAPLLANSYFNSSNAAYAPALFKNSEQRSLIEQTLKKHGYSSRRYFSPSLDTVAAFNKNNTIKCPVSQDISERILCLPLYSGLEKEHVRRICRIIESIL